jgi:cephalosporin hydroxylase
MTDLSVIIPARNEIYLQRTIENVLANSTASTEILAVCDGYWPDPPIHDHPKVNIIHHSEPRGQRQSINEAARLARGKYLMKLDAHCAVSPGFDTILIEDYQEGWTVVPRMYNLDHETWKPKLHKRTDYMYIGMADGRELRAEYYGSKQPSNDKLLDETMCCMGPGWFLSTEQFWKQGGCDEAHGSWGQQGVEVSLKAWLSGNALMVNKRCWFAHWFRGGGGPGFPYAITGKEVDTARHYSKSLWLTDSWPQQTRSLEWLVRRFNPPTWEGHTFQPFHKKESTVLQPTQHDINALLYQHIHRESREPLYRGVKIIKMPTDLALYHEVIWANKPRWIIETGTKFGGSSLFFQDQLDLMGHDGRVITIDIAPANTFHDPRITYVTANSIDRTVLARLHEIVGDDPVMVVLDSAHNRRHVKWELYHYSQLVTPGQYLVVEDCYSRHSRLYGPGEARDWFLRTSRGKQFEQTNLDRRYLAGVCLGGWLRKKPE